MTCPDKYVEPLVDGASKTNYRPLTFVGQSLPVRFWRQVRLSGANGCWEWMGTKTRGYGRIRKDGRGQYAHRVAYEMFIGPIPENLTLDHLCRNRACVNPSHLEPVTMRTNLLRGNTAKLTQEEVSDIRERYDQGSRMRRGNAWQLAKEYGVGRKYISALARKERWVD